MTSKDTNPKDIVGTRKAPLSTVSAPVMAEIGVAMLEGALKYGRHNYRAMGVRGSVYYDATLRHLMAWWEGEDIDPDSGMSHITKAMASLCVLRDSMINENWADDRPPACKDFFKDLNAKASALVDKYSDKNPHHYTQLEMKKVTQKSLEAAGLADDVVATTFGPAAITGMELYASHSVDDDLKFHAKGYTLVGGVINGPEVHIWKAPQDRGPAGVIPDGQIGTPGGEFVFRGDNE